MKKIYLVNYNNGETYAEWYQEYTFKYCYATKSQAIQAMEELEQDKDFLESIPYFGLEDRDIDFWITEVELVD